MRPATRLLLSPLLLAGCLEADKPTDLGEPWTGDSDFTAAASDGSVPDHFGTPAVDALDNTPTDNALTDAGATLGRALFYDPRLSANETVSCASCHQQAAAFADPEALSVGFEGGTTGRHGMPLVNVRWYAPGRMFWDERAQTLEEQVLLPIQDEVEMGMTLDGLVATVAAVDAYGPLLTDAFGDPEVTDGRIAAALAQFVRALVSTDAPYDQGLTAAGGDPRRAFPSFTDDENDGKELFFGRAGCAVCHLGGGGPGGQAAVFYLDGPANNGLDATTVDAGVGDVTGRPQDDASFKSPSLRNIAESGPYMHDGRFDTLAEVVDHYRSGVQPHPNLDPRLARGGAEGLTDREAAQLVAFLETLSDPGFLADDRYADPWGLE